jgi:hypothetical protein
LTAPDSPQQNGKIEKKFSNLYGRVRAILNGAKFTPLLRNGCELYVLYMPQGWKTF